MKSTTTLVFALFTISTLFYNCSPVPITKVNLANEDVGYWMKGTAIGEKVVNDLLVEAVYSHSDKDCIYFDVAFENLSEDRITVGPEGVLLVDPINGGNFNSYDPELRILDLQISNSRRDANNKTLAIVAGAALVAGTVAAVANSGGDSESGASEDSDSDSYVYIDSYLYSDIASDRGLPLNYQYFNQEPLLSTDHRILPSNNEVYFWEEFALRKTTLFPKQRVRGLVVFVKSKYMKESQLIIPTESKDLTFNFVHNEYKP